MTHNRIGHRFQRRLDVPVWLERGPQGLAYSDKVLGIAGGPIAYWRYNEEAGIIADNYEGTAARDAAIAAAGVTYSQTGIGDGLTSLLSDGIAGFSDIYSASLNTAFDGTEGTWFGWFRVSGAGVWTDGTARVLAHLRADADNRWVVYKTAANNAIEMFYEANTILTVRNHTPFSPAGWFSVACTWSDSANIVRYFVDGAKLGADIVAVGTWAGNLDNTRTNVCADVNTPTLVWDGYWAHQIIWDTPLTEAQIATLHTVP